MEKLFPKTIEPVYETEKEMLVLSDTFEALKKINKRYAPQYLQHWNGAGAGGLQNHK